MLLFEGDRDFAQAPDAVFVKLTDARFLVTCIPDVETLTRVEADQASLVLRPGLSFVRGNLEVELRLSELTAPTSARVVLVSKGIGSSSTVDATLRFAAGLDHGTRVHWSAEVKELGGLLKMVPSGLIRGAAQKVINDVWSIIERNLASCQKA